MGSKYGGGAEGMSGGGRALRPSIIGAADYKMLRVEVEVHTLRSKEITEPSNIVPANILEVTCKQSSTFIIHLTNT